MSIGVFNGCFFVYVLFWLYLWASGVSRLCCNERNKTGSLFSWRWSGWLDLRIKKQLYQVRCILFRYARWKRVFHSGYKLLLVQFWHQFASREWCWVSLNPVLIKLTWMGATETGTIKKLRQTWRKIYMGRKGDAIWFLKAIGILVWVLVDAGNICLPARFVYFRWTCTNTYDGIQILDFWKGVGFTKTCWNINFENLFEIRFYGRLCLFKWMCRVECNRVSLYLMISSIEPNKIKFYESVKLEL